MSSLLARIAATERSDLIVMIGYGDELPIFRNARALWQFYAAHFPASRSFSPAGTANCGPAKWCTTTMIC